MKFLVVLLIVSFVSACFAIADLGDTDSRDILGLDSLLENIKGWSTNLNGVFINLSTALAIVVGAVTAVLAALASALSALAQAVAVADYDLLDVLKYVTKLQQIDYSLTINRMVIVTSGSTTTAVTNFQTSYNDIWTKCKEAFNYSFTAIRKITISETSYSGVLNSFVSLKTYTNSFVKVFIESNSYSEVRISEDLARAFAQVGHGVLLLLRAVKVILVGVLAVVGVIAPGVYEALHALVYNLAYILNVTLEFGRRSSQQIKGLSSNSRSMCRATLVSIGGSSEGITKILNETTQLIKSKRTIDIASVRSINVHWETIITRYNSLYKTVSNIYRF